MGAKSGRGKREAMGEMERQMEMERLERKMERQLDSQRTAMQMMEQRISEIDVALRQPQSAQTQASLRQVKQEHVIKLSASKKAVSWEDARMSTKARELQEAIESSVACVAIMTPKYQGSEFCRNELYMAQTKGTREHERLACRELLWQHRVLRNERDDAMGERVDIDAVKRDRAAACHASMRQSGHRMQQGRLARARWSHECRAAVAQVA